MVQSIQTVEYILTKVATSTTSHHRTQGHTHLFCGGNPLHGFLPSALLGPILFKLALVRVVPRSMSTLAEHDALPVPVFELRQSATTSAFSFTKKETHNRIFNRT